MTSSSPRKQPVQARSAATVSAILEAAAHILEAHGFGGYTTNAVAERAGVSIGSLYQYFPNKDAITLALIRKKAEANLAAFEAAYASLEGLTFEAQVAGLVRVAVSQQLDRPLLARRIDIEEARLGKDAETLEAEAASGAVVARLLTQAGRDLPFDLATCVGDLIAIVQGLTDAAGARGETDNAVLMARVLHAVRGYLAAR